ncbi:LOG family protein [candidate division WWE3 bacterium]|nr:LOG family protein [candidate division WWE3 bacterium]
MIIPAIFQKDFEEIKKEVASVEKEATLIQIDVGDGEFITAKSFSEFEKLNTIKTSAKFELHLMVQDPNLYLDKKIESVESVVAQVESKNVEVFLQKTKKLGYRVGVSLNPGTKTEKVAQFIPYVDFVQFMTVIPGAQGNDFEEGVLDKITIFRQTAPKIPIQVDGGIDEFSLAEVLEAGATNIVVGSQIFQSPLDSLKHFEKMAKESREYGHEIKHKIKKVGFFGGAGWKPKDEAYIHAFETAKLLAGEGYEIVNGGGPGVMKASTEGAKAAANEKGVNPRVLAVTYYPAYKHKNYEGTDPLNKFDEEIITTDYFDRTKVMLQNTDLHIVFKGGTGTVSEFGMTWASSRIHEGHHKPIILFGSFWKHIVKEFETHMFIRPGEKELVHIVESPQEILEFIREWNK